jgi:UDP-glucose 4-epimerase
MGRELSDPLVSDTMKVLITGGAGYIGGTIASMCLDKGLTPIVLDNLSTGDQRLTHNRIFYHGDIGDRQLVSRILDEHPDTFATIHCAAAIRAPESVHKPLHFYSENVAKSIALLDTLTARGCSRIIISSSAGVYGPTTNLTVNELSPLNPATPYGRSKAMLETIVHDRCRAGSGLRAIAFRYHNVVGADPKLRSGPRAASGALGQILYSARTGAPFTIAGADWPTLDGTGVRDYVHVWDIACAHLLALRHFDETLPENGQDGMLVADLGTGIGTTVRQLITAAQAAVGKQFDVHIAPRRPGDVPGCVSHSRRADQHFGWKPTFGLAAAISHAWQWDGTQARPKTTDEDAPVTHQLPRPAPGTMSPNLSPVPIGAALHAISTRKSDQR